MCQCFDVHSGISDGVVYVIKDNTFPYPLIFIYSGDITYDFFDTFTLLAHIKDLTYPKSAV